MDAGDILKIKVIIKKAPHPANPVSTKMGEKENRSTIKPLTREKTEEITKVTMILVLIKIGNCPSGAFFIMSILEHNIYPQAHKLLKANAKNTANSPGIVRMMMLAKLPQTAAI